jgi:hypothetical protein
MDGEWGGSRSHQAMQNCGYHELKKGHVAKYIDGEWKLCPLKKN